MNKEILFLLLFLIVMSAAIIVPPYFVICEHLNRCNVGGTTVLP